MCLGCEMWWVESGSTVTAIASHSGLDPELWNPPQGSHLHLYKDASVYVDRRSEWGTLWGLCWRQQVWHFIGVHLLGGTQLGLEQCYLMHTCLITTFGTGFTISGLVLAYAYIFISKKLRLTSQLKSSVIYISGLVLVLPKINMHIKV